MKNLIVGALTSLLFRITSPVNIMRIAKSKIEDEGYNVKRKGKQIVLHKGA